MTIGISKERLETLLNNTDYITANDLLRVLINECTELNQWLPIDENTPKDRKILLLWPELGVMEGEWVVDVFWCDMWELTGCDMDDQPTHWQELPDDPH